MNGKISAYEVGNFPVEVVVAGGKKVRAQKGEYIVFGEGLQTMIVSRETFEKHYKPLIKKEPSHGVPTVS